MARRRRAEKRPVQRDTVYQSELVGRDPSTLRHSFLLFDAESRATGGRFFYWDDVGAFEDLAGRLFEIGYDEIGVYYPIDEQRDVFEAVAGSVIPGLRV